MGQSFSWHKGIGGGRFTFATTPRGTQVKVVETGTGLVLVQETTLDWSGVKSNPTFFDTVEEATTGLIPKPPKV